MNREILGINQFCEEHIQMLSLCLFSFLPSLLSNKLKHLKNEEDEYNASSRSGDSDCSLEEKEIRDQYDHEVKMAVYNTEEIKHTDDHPVFSIQLGCEDDGPFDSEDDARIFYEEIADSHQIELKPGQRSYKNGVLSNIRFVCVQSRRNK
jgi:hypothetical protein